MANSLRLKAILKSVTFATHFLVLRSPEGPAKLWHSRVGEEECVFQILDIAAAQRQPQYAATDSFSLASPRFSVTMPVRFFGGVAKWSKATVCKTVIREFKSHRRLF